MNQTRVFLIFAWLMVAVLLWMEWGREKAAPDPAAVAATQPAVPVADDADLATPVAGNVPQASVPGAAPAMTSAVTSEGAPAAPRVTVTTDVLKLVLDGRSVLDADLLQFPQTKAAGSPPVQLLTEDPAHPYSATAGWVSQGNAAVPGASGFQPATAVTDVVLAEGQDQVQVPFVWNGPDGISINRTYTFKRGDYAISVKDEVSNAGSAPWQAYVFRKLDRVPPVISRGMTNPDSFSFNGATGTARKTATSVARSTTIWRMAISTRPSPVAGRRCCSTISSPHGSRRPTSRRCTCWRRTGRATAWKPVDRASLWHRGRRSAPRHACGSGRRWSTRSPRKT